jgi:hypothetical protein
MSNILTCIVAAIRRHLRRTAVGIAIAGAVVVAVSGVQPFAPDPALAHGSAYSLTWFNVGQAQGGNAVSANYKADITIGQMAVGQAASASHLVCIGFQCVANASQSSIYLPSVMR